MSHSSHKHQTKRCYESHPPLKVGNFLIYGGSCITPSVKDADIYIGFDHGMERHEKRYPWVPGESFLFPIQDMGVPMDVPQFKALLDWVHLQLIAQKKVHMGCIGGHGRTGLVLAALVKQVTGMDDAITYVRDNYCHKAVESNAQIEFLHEHFKIKKVGGSKEAGGTHTGGWGNDFGTSGASSSRSTGQSSKFNERYAGYATPTPKSNGGRTSGGESGKIVAHPAKHPMSVWGPHSKRVS